MSAFIVGDRHIDAMLSAGLHFCMPGSHLKWLEPGEFASSDFERGEIWGPTAVATARALRRELCREPRQRSPAAPRRLEQPVRKVALLPQVGDRRVDGPRALVPAPAAATVAGVGAPRPPGPVARPAQGIYLSTQQRMGERGHHLPLGVGECSLNHADEASAKAPSSWRPLRSPLSLQSFGDGSVARVPDREPPP